MSSLLALGRAPRPSKPSAARQAAERPPQLWIRARVQLERRASAIRNPTSTGKPCKTAYAAPPRMNRKELNVKGVVQSPILLVDR